MADEDVFDLSQFELQDIAVLTLQNIDRTDDLLINGQPVRITIHGPGSPHGVKALHKAGQLAALRFQALMRGKVDKNAATAAEAERIDKLASLTFSVENFPVPGGAAAIYGNPKLIDITDQVEAFFNDKANFSKPSSTT
jgi:hypothetical protein